MVRSTDLNYRLHVEFTDFKKSDNKNQIDLQFLSKSFWENLMLIYQKWSFLVPINKVVGFDRKITVPNGGNCPGLIICRVQKSSSWA